MEAAVKEVSIHYNNTDNSFPRKQYHFTRLNPFHQTDKKPTGTEDWIFKDTIKEMKRNEVK